MDTFSMDDAFADFLTELDATDAQPPQAKKMRNESKEVANPGLTTKQRQQRAEKLRKAAFQGDFAKVEKSLKALSTVDRLLLVDGADPDDGFTALHLAVIGGKLDVVNALLRAKADVDATSDAGDTPLMWASHRGSIAIVSALLQAGADPSLENNARKTAAKQARLERHQQIADVLEEHILRLDAGFRPGASTAVNAGAVRRAANMKLVAQGLREKGEAEEEEAFWASVRARREGRETERGVAERVQSERPRDDDAPKVPTEDYSSLPEKVRCHYATLEVPADATEAEVRKLYRKLALRHHPDKNPGDASATERFRKIAEAYEAVCEHLGSIEVKGVCIAPPTF